MTSRNLVLCFDGTGNQLTTDATNVMRLWSTLVFDAGQVGYYDPGVGTLGDPRVLSTFRRQIRKRLDEAIGYSMRENFIEAYSFIARHYREGDRIFLFGFSRGAYTARAVAGAIHRFGLTQPEHENLAPYVWRTYSNDDGDEDSKTLFQTANRFKKRFTHEVPIHFAGLWDTVSSFGLVTHFRTLPDTRANPSIRIVRHALAIDERRACFRANRCSDSVKGQDFREVWFAGVHSDVGGGYPESESALAKVPLRWMLIEAAQAGLRVDADRVREALSAPEPDGSSPKHESLSGAWHVLEPVPQRRWNNEKKRLSWRMPNFWRRREMMPKANEGGGPSPIPQVHASVKARMADPRAAYKPANLPERVAWVEDGPPIGVAPLAAPSLAPGASRQPA